LPEQPVDESRRAVELANELYLRGLGEFLSVLEAQKSRFEDELAQSETSIVINLVALYKAVGWRLVMRIIVTRTVRFSRLSILAGVDRLTIGGRITGFSLKSRLKGPHCV
jgi:hypothetical protein